MIFTVLRLQGLVGGREDSIDYIETRKDSEKQDHFEARRRRNLQKLLKKEAKLDGADALQEYRQRSHPLTRRMLMHLTKTLRHQDKWTCDCADCRNNVLNEEDARKDVSFKWGRKEMFRDADQDKSGSLDLNEVCLLVDRVWTGDHEQLELWKHQIKSNDVNGDGVLSQAEFDVAMDQLKPNFFNGKAVLAHLVTRVDKVHETQTGALPGSHDAVAALILSKCISMSGVKAEKIMTYLLRGTYIIQFRFFS